MPVFTYTHSTYRTTSAGFVPHRRRGGCKIYPSPALPLIHCRGAYAMPMSTHPKIYRICADKLSK
jgi:hypothetical protein